MDGGDPGLPTHKRPRLDSVNTQYIAAGHPPPPPTATTATTPTQPTHHHHNHNHNHHHPAQPSRHSSLSAPTNVSSPPPPNRHYPPAPPHHPPPPPHSRPSAQHYSLPAPPGQQQQQPHYGPPLPPHHHLHQQSPSVPQQPDNIRLPDPSKFPPQTHRLHGLPGTPVTHSVRISQDSIETYRPPPTPQSATAPDAPPSRPHSVPEDSTMANPNPTSPWNHPHPDPRNGPPPMANGYSTMSPSHAVEQPSFHPPPTQPGPHYAPQPAVGPYSAPPTYMPQQYAPGPGQVRRKQVRATQACNHCRSRKQKCDEARPCQFCRENNFDCQYKDVPVPKQDRSMMQLQESVNSISETLASFVENFNLWKQSVESRLPPPNGGEYMAMSMGQPSPENAFTTSRGSMSEQRPSQMPTPIQARSQLSRVSSMKTESPILMNSHASPVPTNVSTPIKTEMSMANSQPPPTPVESVDHSQSSRDAPQEVEGLQSDHTTPAHMLLPRLAAHWNLESQIPDLKRLTDLGKPITDYPMHYEQDRGLLRVWGIGEGHDSRDGVQGAASPASHNDVDVPSPASAPGQERLFGPILEQSSPSTLGGDYPTHYESVGGLGPDGKPDFRLATLSTLHKAYQEHIHVLHPFLNPYQLEKMIVEFGRQYSPEARASQTMSPAAVPERLSITGLKRKRSNSVYDGLDHYSRPPIERSLRNAIVLLVLALGKVCDHRDAPLPSPHYDRNPLHGGAYPYHRDSPRSANGSFHSEEGEHRQRNVDIIPGMAYFSAATDILGNQIGGNTVAHAQASILAALYHAQFARVLESWSFITNACRISLVLIKADYRYINRDNLKREPDDLNRHNRIPTVNSKERHRLNLIKVIFWTCLQLESDILAEMSTLPPTSITKYQSKIVYPEGVYEHAPDPPHQPEVGPEDAPPKFIYSSLISLRILLNGAHNSLYGAVGNPKNNIHNTAKTMVDILMNWRGVLPSILKWDDTEPPSTDLNVARLRAKVYGAWYVILRPVLFMALEKIKEPPPPDSLSHGNSLAAGGPFAIPPGGVRYTNRGLVDALAGNRQWKELIDLSFDCIEAAIQSTVAFDRVGAAPDSPYTDYVSARKGRLIVTNILGTLHAQFGNMIVLAAVWQSPLRLWLGYDGRKTSLNEHNLCQLFRRTIAILDEMAPNSPILRIDTEILRHIFRGLGLKPLV